MPVSACTIDSPPPSNVRDWMGRREGDWPTEDEENGNYLIQCRCGREVCGPKRAPQCYICHLAGKKHWESLSPEQQQERIVEANKIITQLLG